MAFLTAQGVPMAESTVGTEAAAESVGAGAVDSPGGGQGRLPRSGREAAAPVAVSPADAFGFSCHV